MHRRMWSTALAVLTTAVAPPAVAAAGVTAGATVEAGATTAATGTEPLPLERLFDNQAIGRDGRPGGVGFDGAGNSLSARDLRAAGWLPGTELGLDGARLSWPRQQPAPGRGGGNGEGGDRALRPDNVRADGQHVRLEGRGNAVSFLVAATSPHGAGAAAVGTGGRVHYRDGSTSTYTLRAEDWRGGPLATKAVALPHVNTSDGGQLQEKVKLYAVTVPVVRGRTVTSVELPDDPGPDQDLHIFAAAVRPAQQGWTGSWSASTGGYTGVGQWQDRTLRLVVHTSRGGPSARIRLENTFASSPVRIGSATVAVRGEGAAAEGEPVPLRFGGTRGTVLAAGEREVSDPVDFTVPENTDLLVSIHLPDPVPAAPVHSEAIQRSYLTEGGSGDRTGDSEGGAFTGSLSMWPFLTGVDVEGGPGSVVALGDSITDGVRSTAGANRRWPDVLARRLAEQDGARVPQYGVLNHGISANRIVTDRYPGDGVSTDTAGVSAQNRLERDVLGQTNARALVLFMGINDVRWGASAEDVIAGMKAIAQRARARGLHVVAATVTPCEGYHDCTPEVDRRRNRVNAFVRDSGGAAGVFDEVLDFDAVVRDPERPQRMLPAYDSGDHLHPGDAGLRALGESIELSALKP